MDSITEIKQKLDIATLVGSYVALKKSGKNYKGLCPFHSEKSPSFMVSPELGIFKCFGCQKSGDIFTFLQEIEGVDFTSALEQLAEKAGVKLDKQKIDPEAKFKKQLYSVNEMAARFYNFLLTKHKLGKPGLDYFKGKRKLSDKTIKDFNLGYALDLPDSLFKFFTKKGIDTEILLKAGLIIKKDEGGYMDKFRGRVMFPFTGIDGKVLGFTGRTIFDREPKYLNTAETSVFHKSLFTYGLDKARAAIKKQGAVFVEGNMDVISAHEGGFANVIAASGTSLTSGQLKAVSHYTNDLTFCFDSDSAGVAASFRGIELAENLGFNIKVAVVPAGYKDLDELIKKSREEAVEMFANAVPAYDFLMFSIVRRFNKSSPEGKKKIMDELVPWFSRIKNPVLLDHYSKEIGKELELEAETVVESLKRGVFGGKYASEAAEDTSSGENKNSLPQLPIESYIISLILKGSLDFMKQMTYKVEPQGFTDEKLREVVFKLKEYLGGNHKKFDPKHFEKALDTDLAGIFENLYLLEFELDTEQLQKELDLALTRFNNQSAKRRMHKISEEIRLAEKSNDTKTVKKLTAEFEKLKNNLIRI